MAGDTENAVLAAERRRCTAMLQNDSVVLAALLDERLSFSHATGQVDDKAAYLKKMATGRIAYLSIDWSEAQIIPLGEVALLAGRMTSLVTVEGVEKRLDNQVLAAWTKAGDEWRLVAFQPTPLKT